MSTAATGSPAGPTASPASPAPAPPASGGAGRAVVTRLTDVGFWADWAALVGLVALVVLFGVLDPGFLSSGNVAGMLSAAAALIILAVAQTFVVATAGIDLSLSSVLTLGVVVLGQLYLAGQSLWVCFAGAVLAGLLAGLVNGFLVAKAKVTDFVVTLGMLSAASGLALVLSDAQPVTVTEGFLFTIALDGPVEMVSWIVVIALVVAVLAHVVLFHTRFGTHVLATGGSPEAATATGISTARVKIAVYAIAGLLAGVAALIIVARLGSTPPAANTTLLLNSVAAVVLGGVSLFGGKASILGPVFGALLLTVLLNGLTTMGVSAHYQPLSVGVVVVAAAFLMRFQK
ncbi:ABC transporter permease [Nocardioides zeae]|uniref:ABC transporter permease n=1 Tax=Nocardioides imazamoxiresistens TaxID=3231893 RepID=A0ABU3PVW3_9ACTN|nr:ABC transporter permease [Nocardioides zeae]MDT9593363.1 ABC transporter permease [Nocardioides zeae]